MPLEVSLVAPDGRVLDRMEKRAGDVVCTASD
jgi:hypothetical protein